MIHPITLEVATDATLLKAGISSPDGKYKKTLRFEGELWNRLGIDLQDDIVMKELFAVCAAVDLCQRECNLRILCDSMNVIQQIPKGGKWSSSKAY